MAWLNSALSVIGIAGFFFGLFQYYDAQKWKRLEYAASQLQRLSSDPDLSIAMIFLEYSKRPVPLPEKYWKFAKTEVFEHDCEKLSEVLTIGYFESTPEYFIYRDSLNRLFEYLEQIYQFIEMGLIKVEDVQSLIWILKRIAYPRWIDKESLNNYVMANYEDLPKFLGLFRIYISAKKVT